MLKFTKEEVAGLVSKYYKDHENREIKLRVLIGKIRPITPQNEYALSIDVIERQVLEGEPRDVVTSITKDDFDRAVTTSLEEAGYEASKIKLDYKGQEVLEFAGISVEGEKKEIEHTI